MAALANLVVELSANSAKLVAGMNRAEQRSNQLASTVKKLGATLISAFAARELLHGMEAVVEKFGVQQRAVEELRASLEITGKTGAASLTMLVQNAAALQKVTTTADEALISATSTLAQLAPALNARELQAAQKALIGIADTFAHGDVQNAALLLGKTVGSTTNALTRYGITVNMAGTESQKLAQIVEQSAKFFGVSEARAKTLEGRLTQLKNAWGDLEEAIGGALAAEFKMAGTTASLTGVLQKVTDLVQAGGIKEAFAAAGGIAGNAFLVAFLEAVKGLVALPDTILRGFGIKGKGLGDVLAAALVQPAIDEAKRNMAQIVQNLQLFTPAAPVGPTLPSGGAAGGAVAPRLTAGPMTAKVLGGGGAGSIAAVAGASTVTNMLAHSATQLQERASAAQQHLLQLTGGVQELGHAASVSAAQIVSSAGAMIAGVIQQLRSGGGLSVGGLLGFAGGIASLIPGGQLIGAGLMAGGAILSAATAPSPSNPLPVYDAHVESAIKQQAQRPQRTIVNIVDPVTGAIRQIMDTADRLTHLDAVTRFGAGTTLQVAGG